MIVSLNNHAAVAVLLPPTGECSQLATIQVPQSPQPSTATTQVGPTIQVPPPPAQRQDDIVVLAEKPAIENRPDRKVYDVSNDMSRAGGSAADLLGHIPFVAVDLDGNISIRGDSSVQVLVDGRTTAQLSGSSLGSALQQFDASRIEKIEVLTTPPASLSSGASGGIINIILKPKSTRDSFSLASSVGSAGRFNIAPAGEMALGPIRLHASLGLRRDVRERNAHDHKYTGGANSTDIPISDQTRLTKSRRLGATASGGGSLTLSKRDHVDLDFTYSKRIDHPTYEEYLTSFLAPPKNSTFPVYRSSLGQDSQLNTSASITLRHDTDDKGNGVTFTASSSEGRTAQDFSFIERVPELAKPLRYTQHAGSFDSSRQISLGYDGPLFGSDNVSTGYEIEIDFTNLFQRQGISSLRSFGSLLSPDFTGILRYKRSFSAGFFSYKRSLGELHLEGGVRVERVITYLTPNSFTGSPPTYNLDAIPSLHISNQVGNNGSITLGYSRTVTRPDAGSLVSYATLQDASTIREPNPRLKPEYTDALELGFASASGSKTASYTAYFRRTSDALYLTSTLGDGITYMRLDNAGRSESVGVEVARTGHLVTSISYTLSGSVSYNRASDEQVGLAHGEVTYNAKVAAAWNVSGTSALQANITAIGRRPTPQGYLIGYQQLDLGFRHFLSKRLAATMTVSDLLSTHKDGYRILGSNFTERLIRQQRGRIVSIGISWTPTVKNSPAGDRFDYEK